ncbi:hypothetical protein SDC9_176479 [bioreactor metagenome]|uniref:Uncharacterized protein n=1 Tax=bioreactor metagenome TaxID=1076179 RepID=A0A645GQ48_9ZZZZ
MGKPKIIGSFMEQIPGIIDSFPIVRYSETLLRIIKMTKPSVPPAPPKTEMRNICRFIRWVIVSPLDICSAFSPVCAIPKVKTIGKIIDEPLIPNNHKIFPKVTINRNPPRLPAMSVAGVSTLIIVSGKIFLVVLKKSKLIP